MSLNVLLLVSLLCLALGQQTLYTIAFQYSDSNCNNLVGWAAAPQDTSASSSCQVTSTSCVCDPNNANSCGIVQCNQTSIPPNPKNSIIYKRYSQTGCNSADLTLAVAQLSGTCVSTPATNNSNAFSIRQSCGSYVKYEYWDGVADCAGAATDTADYPVVGTVCVSVGSASAEFTCTNPACIHEDSKFTYKGQEHNFKNLPKECTVPHVTTRDGVKIQTSCPGELRVTHEHLVMTPEGWKEAGSIKVGDLLFSKVGGTETCQVTSLQTEAMQKYSGLNCIESEIEANGYWISTFGSRHHLPAFWMKYGSMVLGVETASSVGDYFANLFYGYY